MSPGRRGLAHLVAVAVDYLIHETLACKLDPKVFYRLLNYPKARGLGKWRAAHVGQVD